MIDVPIWNSRDALSRMGSDSELLTLLVRTFLDDAAIKEQRIAEYVRHGLNNRACLEAHALKGAAATVGAERVAAYARHLETALRISPFPEQMSAALPASPAPATDIPKLLATIREELDLLRQHAVVK